MGQDKSELKKMLDEMRAAAAGDTGSAPAVTEEEMHLKKEEFRSALDINDQEQVRIPIPDSMLKDTKLPEVRRIPGGLLGDGVEGKPETKDRWSRDVPELGKVTCSVTEQESFYRSYLLGERQKIRTSIQVMPGEYFECIVQSLTPGEKEVLSLAVAKSIENHPLLKDTASAEYLKPLMSGEHWLRLEILTRVIQVEGHEWTHYPIELSPDMLPEEYPKLDEMVRAAKLRFHNSQIYSLMLRSLHLASVKFTIMEDALANRDFSDPADAGY